MHFKKDHLLKLKNIPCLFCEKSFAVFDDLMHHIELDHKGMHPQLLQSGTQARQTKKQLGNYVDVNKKGVGLECPECFEIFPNTEKINDHAKLEHNRELDPKFIETMQKTLTESGEEPPICQRCNLRFLGLVFTKMDNKIQNVCLNCYENYFGINALTRLTIGTNEDTLKKMRTPIL